MSAHHGAEVDLMTDKWLIYERAFKALYAPRNLDPVMTAYVIGEMRDAYLRHAPTLEEMPECPKVVHDYVATVTFGLLGEVGKRAAEEWSMTQTLEAAHAACLAVVAEAPHGR